ncbi:hypothetical protein F5Y10DRAFT_265716 [Nemania abortiva]|nr:hypothetical protein F5Y10DRAFT_265716 [Nemania abortiva]
MQTSWDIWLCGHITNVEDGSRVSDNAQLGHVPRYDRERTDIERRFGDECPECYTKQVVQRLRGMRALLLATTTHHEAAQMANNRLIALREFYSQPGGQGILFESGNTFRNYPPEFAHMIGHIIDLENEIFQATIDDFAASHRRLGSRASLHFLNRIHQIRDAAALWSAGGNLTVRNCFREILAEADPILREVERHDAEELRLLQELETNVSGLRQLINERRRDRQSQTEALRSPTFETPREPGAPGYDAWGTDFFDSSD